MAAATLNHAAIAGVKAAIEYVAALGTGSDLRQRIISAMKLLSAYEHALGRELYDVLGSMEHVIVHGQTFDSPQRAPTVSFSVEGKRPTEVCKQLADKGICAWDGHFYAIRPMEVLGLLENGGVTRVGISLYNTSEEISRLLSVLREMH